MFPMKYYSSGFGNTFFSYAWLNYTLYKLLVNPRNYMIFFTVFDE